MEEMAVGPGHPAGPAPRRGDGGTAPADLREWMRAVERIGQLRRITAPVSRNEEMGAITYLAHREIDAPALLFENIRESPKGFRALWNPIGSSVDRFALAIGEPPGLGVTDLIDGPRPKLWALED
jgi:UbiD family decarboxylase